MISSPPGDSSCFGSLPPLLSCLLTLAPAVSAFARVQEHPPLVHGPLGYDGNDNKFLPGDLLYISYEIEGLKVRPEETKKACAYVTLLEVFSSTKEKIFSKESPNELIPQLGGDRIPGDLHLIMGRNKPAGQYVLRMTIQDRVGGETKSFTHSFELLNPGFGIVALQAPAIAFPGQPYIAQLVLIDFTLDAEQGPEGLDRDEDHRRGRQGSVAGPVEQVPRGPDRRD